MDKFHIGDWVALFDKENGNKNPLIGIVEEIKPWSDKITYMTVSGTEFELDSENEMWDIKKVEHIDWY